MKEYIFQFVNGILNSQYPLIGLIITAIAESSFFPIPPDTILIPMAFFAPKMAIFYGLITTISSVLGGILGYFIGKKGGKAVVYRFISEEKLYKIKLFYNKYDIWAVAISGLTPIPYKLFTIAAGLFDLNLKKFILASFIGRGGRFITISILIYFFGPAMKSFLTKYFEIFTLLFTFLLIGGFVFINIILKRKGSNLVKENNSQI